MTDPGPLATKAEWRRWARRLAPVDAVLAHAVSGHLQRFLADVDDPILAYVALGDEVPIDALLRPGALGGEVVLPRIDDDGAMTLHLDDGGRERSVVGIEQPTATQRQVDSSVLGAVVVPGRIFDHDGYRLGRGGGHYDRLVPHLDPTVPVIGVTTRSRMVERLPREPHDHPMTHLVDEGGITSLV